MNVLFYTAKYPFARQTEGASGFDLHALLDEPILLEPWQNRLILSGIYVTMPFGLEAQVRPRSGMGKRGLIPMLGTIDSDYRGDCTINLFNFSASGQQISPGDRIAQLVFAPVLYPTLTQVDQLSELPDTIRGDRGFGSTGV